MGLIWYAAFEKVELVRGVLLLLYCYDVFCK